MPDSNLREFGRWVSSESWENIIKGENTKEMFEAFIWK